MSVKVENRPENRFEILVKYNEMVKEVFKTINTDAKLTGHMLYISSINELIDRIVKARYCLLSANEENTYSTESYEKRRDFHTKFKDHIIWMYSFFDMIARLHIEKDEEPIEFANILKILGTTKKMITNLVNSDYQKYKNGPVKTKEEFEALKQRDFYQKHTYDNTKISESTAHSKDKFNLGDLVFVKPETDETIDNTNF